MDAYHYVQIGLSLVQIVVVPLLALGYRQYRSLAREVRSLQGTASSLQTQVDSAAQRCQERRQSSAQLGGEVDSLRDRLSRVEVTVPSTAALKDLAVIIERTTGQVNALTERLDGLRGVVERLDRVLNRHEDYLLNKGS